MKEKGSEGLALMVALMASSTTFCRLCSSMYWAAACGPGRAAANQTAGQRSGKGSPAQRHGSRGNGGEAATACQGAARQRHGFLCLSEKEG